MSQGVDLTQVPSAIKWTVNAVMSKDGYVITDYYFTQEAAIRSIINELFEYYKLDSSKLFFGMNEIIKAAKNSVKLEIKFGPVMKYYIFETGNSIGNCLIFNLLDYVTDEDKLSGKLKELVEK